MLIYSWSGWMSPTERGVQKLRMTRSRGTTFFKGALIKRYMRFSLFPNILLNISQILRGPPLGPRPFEDDYVIIKVKFCLIVLKPFSKKHSFLARSTQSASNSTSIIQSHNEYVIQIPKVTS